MKPLLFLSGSIVLNYTSVNNCIQTTNHILSFNALLLFTDSLVKQYFQTGYQTKPVRLVKIRQQCEPSTLYNECKAIINRKSECETDWTQVSIAGWLSNGMCVCVSACRELEFVTGVNMSFILLRLNLTWGLITNNKCNVREFLQQM